MRTWAFALALAAEPALAFPSAPAPFPAGHPLAGAYAAAEGAVRAEDWPAAEAMLVALSAQAGEVASVWSLLGLSLRKQGRLGEAEGAYDRALALDDEHRGALEYLGELRLQQGDLDAAQALLARLAVACPIGCEERLELMQAIAAYRGRQ